MDGDETNRWAVYPIEKIEAAMKELSEAVTLARSRYHAPTDDLELDKILCPGCRDNMPKDSCVHLWADGTCYESCYATEQRKRALREYFANEKNHIVQG